LVAELDPADIQDRDGGSPAANNDLCGRFASLQVIYADAGNNGKCHKGVNASEKPRLEVIARNRQAEAPPPPAETAKAPETSSREASPLPASGSPQWASPALRRPADPPRPELSIRR
jgi:hypothetical protein